MCLDALRFSETNIYSSGNADLSSFCVRGCRSIQYFSLTLSYSGSTTFSFVEIVASLLSNKRSKRFHNCSLIRAGKLPQRPAQRRITSQALFTLVYSKQIQTVWSFVKRSIFIKNMPRFFGIL
jgi:hypothetical protein